MLLIRTSCAYKYTSVSAIAKGRNLRVRRAGCSKPLVGDEGRTAVPLRAGRRAWAPARGRPGGCRGSAVPGKRRAPAVLWT